jgi:tetratricopeptide (TPR) repeat protein
MMLGRFDRKFYIDFLRDVDEAAMSGILRLRSNRNIKALFFESGYLVFGISNVPDEELGQHLVNLGRITPAQLQGAWTQVNRDLPLIRVLQNYQLVSYQDLLQAETEVVSSIAVSCLNWESGEYSFDGSKTADHEFKTQIRPLDVLAQGIRRIRDEAFLVSVIGNYKQYVRPVFDLSFRLERIKPSLHEEKLLSLLNCPKTILQLIVETGLAEYDLLRALYVLLATGILDPLEDIDFDTGSEEVMVMDDVEDVPLAPTPSTPRASGAFRRLSSLDQTYSTLRTAEQSQKPIAGAPFVGTPVPSNSNMAKPDPKVESTIKKAVNPMKIDTAKLEALAGIKIRSSGGGHSEENEKRAEQAFIQGKQALRMGDTKRAETFFRQAAEVLPDKAKYALALALLLVKRPTSRKEAEGLFLHCCELEPRAIEPRIQLAGIYEQTGLTDKADQLYRSVLNIDPKHPIATQKLKKDAGSIGSIFKSFLKRD